MNAILLPCLIAAFLPSSARQPAPVNPPPSPESVESLDSIEICIATRKAEALEAYLVANPNATDMGIGLLHLSYCYLTLGDEVRQLAVLQREYAAISNRADSNLEPIKINLHAQVRLLTRSKVVADTAKAKAVIEQARKDLAHHADAGLTSSLFADLEGLLNRPSLGGTLQIAFTALDGTKVDLAAMKGKVVLVDFWATWCGPCLAELPSVKATYDKYHDKGFEVVGISLDSAEDKTKLENFIKKKSLTWPQSFEGQGWNHPLAVKYGITSIPATFLVDKNGKISAIGMSGHELDAKVAALLK